MPATQIGAPKPAGTIKIITIQHVIIKGIIISNPGFDSLTSTKQKRKTNFIMA